MLAIALTGGIGSGKSAVANFFAKHHVPIIDADIIAREVTQPGQHALKEIVEHFGIGILNDDKTLNRGLLRKKIFNEPTERVWLETLLHPIILGKIKDDLQQLTAPYCIVVIPLLFESDAHTLTQRTIVVDCPESTQLKRIMARDHISQDEAKAMMATQVSRTTRLEKADDIIVNDGSLADLELKVSQLHNKLMGSAPGNK